MQLKSRQENLTHPKLQEMIQSVITWMATFRKHKREKVVYATCPNNCHDEYLFNMQAVVAVGREFPTVSGDLLDVLQSIRGSSSVYMGP